MSKAGYVHSLQSLGTLDGPGVRAVVFTEGCPLRCIYCHNPDTWECRKDDICSSEELAEKILRLYPYIKNGGVTFSGGEPCLQADFIYDAAKRLKERGLHIALDTCGAVYNDAVERLLTLTDLVLLDIKMTTEEDYERYIGGKLSDVIFFLGKLEKLGIATTVRHVVVGGINDTAEDMERLASLIGGYTCVREVELLPFKKLCSEKYRSLGIPFLLEDTPQMSESELSRLKSYFDEIRRKN
ncbi:MAG: pyruvate formate lyase-activating protein [Clostridia bacterium]|nr:pyruvate formate lyase-activating protein [Clostridia bacterium]